MSEAGPWLVLGGAVVIIACVAVVLLVIVRGLLRTRHGDGDDGNALAVLEETLAGGTPEADSLMPLLLAAAIEVSGADAAGLTFVTASGRRRSYSANFEAASARQAIQELLESEAPAADYERVVVPISTPAGSGALGMYWRDRAPSDPDRVAAELERLVAATFRDRAQPPARAGRVDVPASEPWSRVADFNATLELEQLLRKVVEAAVEESAADGAAASVRDPVLGGHVAETVRLDEHERVWVDPILSAETVVPSITRYVGLQSPSETAIATTIVVPLRDADAEAIGNLVAVWRRDVGDEVDARLADLEALADHARIALDNAVRFQRLQAVAVRDPATGIFDQRYFLGALTDACNAAQEYSEPLLLVVLSAVEVARDVELAALQTFLAGSAAQIAGVVGGSGITCCVGLGTFAAIVPNTTRAAAGDLLDSLESALTDAHFADSAVSWRLSAVERRRYEQADALWKRAIGELGPVTREFKRAATAG